MRRKLEDIEIIEPPVQELKKRHGFIVHTCLTGCLFIVIFFIGLFVLLRFAAGPGPQTLRTVPANFPADIPVYDRDNVEKITFISGQYKNRGLEIAAFFPKIILSPLLMNLNQAPSDTASSTSGWESRWATVRGLWQLVSAPVGDHRDTVQLEWVDVETDIKFIINYYQNELKRNKFSIDVESEGQGVRQFSFSRASDGLSGSVYAKSDPEYRNRIEYLIVTVNMGTSTTR